MKKTEEYQKVIHELIKESFPILKEERIRLIEIPPKHSHLIVIPVSWFNLLLIGKGIREIDKIALKGMLAHELCHIEYYRIHLKNPLQIMKYETKSLFNKKFNRKIERETDLLTIKKGYGRGLLKFVLLLEKFLKTKEKIKKYYSNGYLNPQEIKFYMKKCQQRN